MKLTVSIAVILLASLLAFSGCSSSAASNSNQAANKSAANSNANAVATVAATETLEGSTLKLVLEGQVVAPTEASRSLAIAAAKARKYNAEQAADQKSYKASSDANSASYSVDKEALAAFKAADNPGYVKYLEYKETYDFNIEKQLEKSSPAYLAYKAKTSQADAASTRVKEQAEFQETQDKFIAEIVFHKELELIDQKYGSQP